MPIGNPVTKAEVNATITTVSRQLHSVMAVIDQFQTYLVATPDTDLVAMGFVQAEVNQIKSAMVDANALRNVFLGTAIRNPAYDHRTFLKLALGTGTY